MLTLMALLDLLDSPMLYIPHFSFVTVNIDWVLIRPIGHTMNWKNIFRKMVIVM